MRSVDPAPFREIPVVSLRDWTAPGADRDAFADRLRSICHEVGFFQLVDHGVDRSFLDEYFGAMRTFFELPEVVKQRIDKASSPWFRGWERVGAELTDHRVDHRVIAAGERYSSGYFHGPALATPLRPLPLDRRFADAVATSEHHRTAGFMARRSELLDGARGTVSTAAETYGQQLWNYFGRSYPQLMARHHPDVAVPAPR
jgi:isopenicillin N synthase-like dioxygenase